MKNNIIKTDDYLLIVSDEEIKVKDKVYWTDPEDGISSKINTALEIYEDLIFMSEPNASEIEAFPHEVKKITAHLPLNNSRILEGVDLLPPLEDDETICPYPEEKQNAVDWHNGYNKAKEKYKYTEDDLRKAIDMAREQYLVKYTDNDYEFEHKEDEIIQSLQQPKYPIGFESEEYQELCLNCEWQHDSCPNAEDCLKPKPKTTTNSQGQTVLEGKYIYE